MKLLHVLVPVVLAACSKADAPTAEPGPVGDPVDASAPPDAAVDAPTPPPDAPVVVPVAPLEVRALGVQGFVLRHGGESVMTAPMFTRQSGIEVTLNLPLSPDDAATDSGLAGVALDEVRAIVTGHAHYDHFIDVAHVMTLAPNATTYANLTAKHVFAALAPDRPASCASPAPSPTIARDRLVAMDDPLASHVDYTNCPGQRPAGAPMEGSWVKIPDSHVRLMAFCSMHPPQVGPYHFGEGSIDADQCDLPAAASGWLEGQTLAFLIDFLDDAGKPEMRVFYQDAPTDPPIGHVPAAILAEKQVDMAILCVGNYDAVANQPGDIVANLSPRFVFSGHWEDFFVPSDQPPQPILFLNLDTYLERAEAAMPGPADAPLLVDGAPLDARHVLITPGSQLVVPPAPSSQ